MNHDDVPTLIVTLPVAAKMLGVSRGRTLAALIDSGKVQTIKVNGSTRIPLSEIERLCREGFDVRQS